MLLNDAEDVVILPPEKRSRGPQGVNNEGGVDALTPRKRTADEDPMLLLSLPETNETINCRSNEKKFRGDDSSMHSVACPMPHSHASSSYESHPSSSSSCLEIVPFVPDPRDKLFGPPNDDHALSNSSFLSLDLPSSHFAYFPRYRELSPPLAPGTPIDVPEQQLVPYNPSLFPSK